MKAKNTHINKVLHMFGAQTYGTLINMVDKLATVPLFLFFWGIDLYGEWLILRAVPAYFAIAELGFSSAAANKMSVLVIREKYKEANSYFQSTLSLLAVITVFTLLSVACLIINIDVKSLFNFSEAFNYSILNVVLLMLGYTLLIFQTQLFSAVYRAVGEYVKGAYITYNIRVCELVGVVVGLYFEAGLLEIAFIYFMVRLVGTLIMAIFLLKQNKWLKIGFYDASTKLIKDMLPNAAGFLAFPLGQAINLQGLLFIIANMSSPAVVALFATSRTLARVITQLGMQVNRSVWPELTRLMTENLRDQAKTLYLNALSGFLYIGTIASTVLLLLTPTIFYVWTTNKITPDLVLFSLLLVSSLFNGLWFSALSILSATNAHKRIAIFYLLINIVMLMSIYLLNTTLNLNNIGWVMVVAELFMLLLIINSSFKQLKILKFEFLLHTLYMPLNAYKAITSKVRN